MRNNGRRLMPLSFGTPLPYVPYDAEVEYLESTGTQYINTGYKPNQDTRVVATMQCVTSNNYGRLFGAGTHNAVGGYMIDYENGSTGTLHIKYGANNAWTSVSSVKGDYNVHTYDYNKNVVYMDGIQVSSTTYTAFQSTSNLGIFTYINGSAVGSATEWFKGRVFAFKIYDNGILVRDFIPVRIGQVGYLYDKVGKLFYSNVGTGDFSLGRDIDGIQEVEYIESNGSQYFALPIYANRSTDAFEITYQQTTNTNKCRFLATYYGYNKETNSGLYDSNTCPVNFYIQGTGKYGLYTTGWANIFNATVGTFKDTVKIDYKNKKFYVNGYEGNGTGNNTKSTDSNPLFIFLPHSGDVALTKAKLFGFRFWRNNVLQMDCVPVRKRGKGYLYDKINKKYYGNFGTGSWVIGADTGDISKYTRVDYIQNTNNAYIDTGFIPNQDTKVWFDMKLSSDVVQTSGKYPCLFGVRQSAKTKSFRLTFPQLGSTGSTEKMYYEFGTSDDYGMTDFSFTNDRVTGYFSKDGLIINNYSCDVTQSSDFTSPSNLLLFRYVNGNTNIHGGDGDSFKGYLYGFKIWDGETLVRDFVPVRNQLNIHGLWDLVEGKFYPSSSATAFSGGNFS